MRRTDPLIVGGGPAGAAAAITLASRGAASTMLERTAETGDALCGGFLSWHTLASLDKLGIAQDDLGGHPITRVRVFARSRMAEATLPASAIGVSRYRLDTIMIAQAARLGVRIERNVTARSVEGQTVHLSDGAAFDADALFLATGKHNLRGSARSADDADPTLGLRIKLGPHPALSKMIGDAIELHLFDRGYAGLLMQEDGRANLCLAVRKSRLAEAGGRPDTLLRELGEATPLGERLSYTENGASFDAIGAVPYGWRAHDTAPGVFRLGDQAAVIPSLAGEGIGIAVASGAAAASAWLAGGPAAAPGYQQSFYKRARRPVGIAKMLWLAGESNLGGPLGTAMLRTAPGLAWLLARATRIGD